MNGTKDAAMACMAIRPRNLFLVRGNTTSCHHAVHVMPGFNTSQVLRDLLVKISDLLFRTWWMMCKVELLGSKSLLLLDFKFQTPSGFLNLLACILVESLLFNELVYL